MTAMHGSDNVRTLVQSSVFQWRGDETSVINVHLTCGCGPKMEWVNLREYWPKSMKAVAYHQYPKSTNGSTTLAEVYAPPLAIFVPHPSIVGKCEMFLDDMIVEYLDDFCEECFRLRDTDGETSFPTELIKLLAKLFRGLEPDEGVSASITRVTYTSDLLTIGRDCGLTCATFSVC